MIRNAFLISLAAATLAASCQREATAPIASPPAADTATVKEAISETMMAEPGVQPVADAIDGKAFAGNFSGTLPCADCPGIDETLQLHSDGSFTLTDVYQERPDGTNTVHGTWTIEAGATRLRLDPDSKSDRDRLFAIDGNDTLTQLDGDGNAIDSELNFSLQRER